MHCPLCLDTDLDPVVRSGIEIDRCPNCKGIWLDRGELDKLLGGVSPRAVDNHVRPDLRTYDDTRRHARHDFDREHSYDHRTSKKGKKKKSKGQKLADLLDEVLDF